MKKNRHTNNVHDKTETKKSINVKQLNVIPQEQTKFYTVIFLCYHFYRDRYQLHM